MFYDYLFKSLVTNYVNKRRIDSVIFCLLCTWYMWNLQIFDQFSRKVQFSVFCGANHQKRSNFLFCLKSILLCYNLWNKKPKFNIWRPHPKSIPYPLPLYSGDNVISKVLKKLSLVESLFNLNIGLWSASQKSTKLHHRWFHDNIFK